MTTHVHDCKTCGGYWDCGDEDCEFEQDESCYQCKWRNLIDRHQRLRLAAVAFLDCSPQDYPEAEKVLRAALAEEGRPDVTLPPTEEELEARNAPTASQEPREGPPEGSPGHQEPPSGGQGPPGA